MSRARYANLAVLPIVFLLLAMGPLKEPLKVHFQLADGARISGDLTTWDNDGIDGSFGRRLWIDLKPDDVWDIHRRVMDQQAGEQWVNLGRVMLLMSHDQKRAQSLAERSFARALQLDESAGGKIQSARDEAVAAERKRREGEKAAQAEKLSTISPEGDPWPADPWPTLTDQEQKGAVQTMRADADRILQQAGMAVVPVETDHFLLYTDLPRAEAAQWVMKLEKAMEVLDRVLGGQANGFRGFWGKATVFVFKEQDRFRLVEADAFKHLVPQAAVGVCHPAGPKISICLRYLDDDVELFEWTLVREMVHGYMHRFRTPRRLPAWANEGLAEFVASLALKDSSLADQHRKQGLEFIRNGGNVNGLLDLNYAAQTWPGPKGIGAPVGGLLIELIAKDQPKRFIDWIIAVKGGKEWEESMPAELGTSRAKLVDTLTQFYKVND
jgi:hypothetical protein